MPAGSCSLWGSWKISPCVLQDSGDCHQSLVLFVDTSLQSLLHYPMEGLSNLDGEVGLMFDLKSGSFLLSCTVVNLFSYRNKEFFLWGWLFSNNIWKFLVEICLVVSDLLLFFSLSLTIALCFEFIGQSTDEDLIQTSLRLTLMMLNSENIFRLASLEGIFYIGVTSNCRKNFHVFILFSLWEPASRRDLLSKHQVYWGFIILGDWNCR